MSVMAIEGNQGSMSRVLVMPVEGILRKEVGGQINPDGFALYRALQHSYRIILVATWDHERQRVVDWLEREGIFGYDDLLLPLGMAMNATEALWVNVIRICHNHGYSLSMAVLNGPQEALAVISMGVPVLLYSQPAYGLPEWLPGSRKGSHDWSDLVDKIETERSARVNDRRMEETLK
jgi:hypothetical protein